MRFIVLLAASLVGSAPAAQAQVPAPAAPDAAPAAAFWSVWNESLRFAPAKLSVPRRIAGAEYYESTEFSRKGEGVDTAVKYRSADQKIFATLYVYYPSIAHTGVQAIATDQAIRSARSPNIRSLGAGVASAGGRPNVAVTSDYDHYLGDNRTRAAFIKAGRWMLKLRVTGPESRSAEVAAVMKALLDGLRFEGEVKPSPAEPIRAGECAAAERPDAAIGSDGGEAANVAMADAAGADKKGFAGRIGGEWCRTLLPVRDQKMAVLQATGKGRPDGDSALLMLYSDGGGVLEVVRLAKDSYLLLHHGIAEVNVLDAYDRLPSLAQIGRFFVEPVQVRARVKLSPDGGPEIQLPGSVEDKH